MSFFEVSGTEIDINGLPPLAIMYSACASSTGDDGTEKGSFVIITLVRYSPGKSRPSEKLCVPKIILSCFLSQSALWVSIIFCRDCSPCTNILSSVCSRRAVTTLSICQYDENKTNVALPRLICSGNLAISSSVKGSALGSYCILGIISCALF